MDIFNKIMKNSSILTNISCLRQAVELSGLPYNEVIILMRYARDNYNINFKTFLKRKLWEIEPTERDDVYAKMKKNQSYKTYCIELAMNENGWMKEEAENHINKCINYGISFYKYASKEVYKLNNIEIEALASEIRESKQIAKVKRKRGREEAITDVMEQTGWNHKEASAKIQDAWKRTKCMYKEYAIYRFYELTPEQQEEVFVRDLSVKLSNKYDTDLNLIITLKDKCATNERFAHCIHRNWIATDNMNYIAFSEKFSDRRIVYKPQKGNRGGGIKCYDTTGKIKYIYEELISMPNGVVEEFIDQHDDISKIFPGSVNTVRIVTISSNEKPVTKDGKMCDIAFASLRIGGGANESIVDNIHSGGMVTNIDIQTGYTVTDGANYSGDVFKIHPVTGTPIKGQKIPYFSEAIEMILNTIDDQRITGYLGWDIAITKRGPELVEINTSPGGILLTMPYVAKHMGMKHVMEKYL